jgi:hypothetical protein
VSATAVRLLRAASDMLGGAKALAQRLGIRETLLHQFMAGVHDLPDPLLLRAVDIILEERQFRLALAGPLTAQPAQEPIRDG